MVTLVRKPRICILHNNYFSLFSFSANSNVLFSFSATDISILPVPSVSHVLPELNESVRVALLERAVPREGIRLLLDNGTKRCGRWPNTSYYSLYWRPGTFVVCPHFACSTTPPSEQLTNARKMWTWPRITASWLNETPATYDTTGKARMVSFVKNKYIAAKLIPTLPSTDMSDSRV